MNEELAIIRTLEVARVYDSRFLGMNFIVDYESVGTQDILGGMCLYNNCQNEQSSYAARIIWEVLEALNIDEPSQGVGKYIRVLGEGEGFNFKPKGFKTMKGYGEEKTVLFAIRDEEKGEL